jgi:hypothetical protein
MKESPFPKYNKFENLEDPFNQQNKISGYISIHENDELYGALWIDSVNGKPTGQLLYMTPKLHYPFEKGNDEKRKYRFPDYERIEIFEKYDGTNIVAFKYRDADWNDYISYKTRGSPFVRNNKFNKFFDLWTEIIQLYPDIPKLVESYRSLSFEIFGSRNRILIDYNFPLDVKLLFLINPANGIISSPLTLAIPEGLRFPAVAKIYGKMDKGENLPKKYEEMQQVIQEDLEKKNKGIKITDDEKALKKIRSELLEKGMKGVEGCVWYVKNPHSENNWAMYKCKPDIVEQIHWNVGTISSFGIYTTCINAMEEIDNLNYNTLLPFLLEEYNLPDVEAMREIIERIISQIKSEIAFNSIVIEKYGEIKSKIISTEKQAVLREISPFFKKTEMSKVYNALVKEGILK